MAAAAPSRPGTAAPRRSTRFPPTTVVFALLLVVGIVLRIHVVGTQNGRLNADDAVTYLQAVGASHGHFDVFFWGQAYGGSILPWTVGALMRVTSRSENTYQIGAALWWLAVTLVWRALATRLADRAAGDLLGAGIWVGTAFGTAFSVTEPDFYGPTLALGGAALLVATTAAPRPRAALGVGLLGGLGFWAVPIGAAFSLPALLLLFTRGRTRPLLAPAATGIVVGALPWLVFNVRNHSLSLQQQREPIPSIPHRVVAELTDMLPWALPGAEHHGVRTAVAIGFALCLVLGTVEAVVHRRPDRLAVAVSGLLAVLVVAATFTPLTEASVRYAVFLLPPAAALASIALTRLRTGQLVACVVATALCAVSTHTLLTGPGSQRRTDGFGPPPRYPWGDLRALERDLEAHGDTAVWANYWTSYPLTADTRQRVVAAPLHPTRYPPFTRIVAARSPTVVVVAPGMPDDRALRRERGLPAYQRTVVGGFVIYRFAGYVPLPMLPRSPF